MVNCLIFWLIKPKVSELWDIEGKNKNTFFILLYVDVATFSWEKHRKAQIGNLYSLLETVHGLSVSKLNMIQGSSEYVEMSIV